MRVRPHRPTSRRLLGLRRPHVIGSPAADPVPAEPSASERQPAAVEPQPATSELPPGHLDEARHRAAVNPEDHALYRCMCGFQFEADVSASVCCPHCGQSQAW